MRHTVHMGTMISTERLLIDLTRHIGRYLSAVFDSYRPELHYMRGPGPKWHEKHDPAPPQGPSRVSL